MEHTTVSGLPIVVETQGGPFHRAETGLRFRRILGAAFALALLLFVMNPPAARAQETSCDWSGASYTDFYDPPNLGFLRLDRLGELLRVEHIATFSSRDVAREAGLLTSPYGAQLYRILYLSQSPVGTARAVSGLLAVPLGSKPADGFPVVSFGNGTVGVADQCAPSRQASFYDSRLMQFVARGYMAVASDYVGLGTPGLHPYGVGEAAGRSMLDAARAALDFCDTGQGVDKVAANDIFLAGHSQGGHSALFAQELWPTYAAELDILGTVVYAPGAEPRFLVQQMAKQQLSSRIAPFAMAAVAFQDYYGEPADLSDWLVAPYPETLPELVESQCTAGLAATLGAQPENVFTSFLLDNARADRWDLLEPLTDLLDQNTPGNYTSERPVLIAQGQVDQTVPFGASQRLTERLCAQGTPVSLSRYPLATHFNIVRSAQKEVFAWMLDRLSTEPVSSICTQPRPASLEKPVVLTGSDLPGLLGVSTSDLFAYAYDEINNLHQIVLQIDEITADGAYVTTEDGLLDENDEIVLLVESLGDEIPDERFFDQYLPIRSPWYRVAVERADPTLGPGIAYLVQSAVLQPQTPTRRISYDPALQQWTGDGYQLARSGSGTALDTLSLNGGPNILDRLKLRACSGLETCPPLGSTDLFTGQEPVHTGPLRSVVGQGVMVVYPSQVEIALPTGNAAALQVSLDLIPAATGASVHSNGFSSILTVDGITETVDGITTTLPVGSSSAWWQLNTDTGTLATFLDPSSAAATTALYYQDDYATVEPLDPGDRRHFGDFGYVVAPAAAAGHVTFYLQPGVQPALAEQLAAQRLSSRQIAIRQFNAGGASSFQLFLPLTSR